MTRKFVIRHKSTLARVNQVFTSRQRAEECLSEYVYYDKHGNEVCDFEVYLLEE